jgi:transposase-like protein
MTTAYKKIYSRRKTPWDYCKVLTPVQEFIKSKYLESYNFKHPLISESSEIDLLNSFIIDNCKICGLKNIQKYGYTKTGIQRYYCNDCKHSFTVLTNTIFDKRKISITEWIEFCLDIFRYESLNVTSKTNKNSATTTKYWLKKLFLLLEDYQNTIILQGDIYIDETYFPVIKTDMILKNGKGLRGLSRNQYCIAIGYDGSEVYAYLEGVGKTSQKKTEEAFLKHIKERSTLIHDKEKAHKILVKKLHLEEKAYDASECKKLGNKNNPLKEINRQCRMLQRFLKSHDGFNREDMQSYLNLYCYIANPPIKKLEKIEVLLISAMSNPKTLKYRDLFKRKPL